MVTDPMDDIREACAMIQRGSGHDDWVLTSGQAAALGVDVTRLRLRNEKGASDGKDCEGGA